MAPPDRARLLRSNAVEFAAFAFFVLYLLPWVAAVAREHERHAAILAANLLVGWTGLGWVAVLAFAVRSDPAPSRARARRNRPALHVVRGEAAVRTSPRAHVALVPTHR